MATLNVQVLDVPDEILERVDGRLLANESTIRDLVRAALWPIKDELAEIVEGANDIEGKDLMTLASDLERLAALVEAVCSRRGDA